MNTKRTLAIAISLATLASTSLALADERPGRGHGDRDYYSERQHRYGPRAAHQDRDGRRHRDADRRDNRFEDRIDNRQDRQMDRIRDGWRSGDLTRKEVERLRKQQQKIERMQDRFDKDGRYTKAEREKLRKALERADQSIRKQRHDDDQRYRRSPDWWRYDDRYSQRWYPGYNPYPSYKGYPGYYRYPSHPLFHWQRWMD